MRRLASGRNLWSNASTISFAALPAFISSSFFSITNFRFHIQQKYVHFVTLCDPQFRWKQKQTSKFLNIQRRLNNCSSSSNLIIGIFFPRWIHQYFLFLFLLHRPVCCWFLSFFSFFFFGKGRKGNRLKMCFTTGSFLQFFLALLIGI